MGLISRVTIFLHHIRGLITLLLTTHEPPSRVQDLRVPVFVFTALRCVHGLRFGDFGFGVLGFRVWGLSVACLEC